ncbi:MAG: hypothetical protein IKT46_00700 [Clostridia bacterium]|nr:hypothetical protein [Clostridia bacterium]
MSIRGVSDSTASALYALINPKAKREETKVSKPASKQEDKYALKRDELLDSYLNREPYEFNINTDKLYRQYADMYKKQGEAAMRDTVAQASEKTGGYGSSYAVTAGSQAYQGYLDKLNSIVPQLEQNAYDRYRDKDSSMLEALSTLDDLDTKEYKKQRDSYEDYKDMRDYYRKVYEYESDYDYDMYKALTDYVLALAKLENSSVAKEADQKIALVNRLS